MNDTSPLRRVAARQRALGHAARVRILAMLRSGELCVCQVTAVLTLAPSTVSAHLAELRRADLIRERRDGRWVYYALSPSAGDQIPTGVWDELDRDPRIRADAAEVRTLRRFPVEELCRVDLDIQRLVPLATVTDEDEGE
jgi:DNA-binding transcriptional ArsR family regulator